MTDKNGVNRSSGSCLLFTGVGDFPDSSLSLALASVYFTILGSYSKESLLMTQKANWPTDLLYFFLTVKTLLTDNYGPNDTDSTPTGCLEVILVAWKE